MHSIFCMLHFGCLTCARTPTANDYSMISTCAIFQKSFIDKFWFIQILYFSGSYAQGKGYC